jgi:hypothetical protein
LDDVVADGVDDQFGEGVEVEFEHYVGAVGFGGVDADAEEAGYFLVAFALGEELEYFAFARREAGAGGFRVVGGVGSGRGLGDAGGEEGFVLAESVNGVEEDAVGFVLENEAAGAGLNDLLNEVVGLVHGEDENFGGWGGFANVACGFDTVEERHADVEDGDVWLMLRGFFDSVAAVGGFGANLPAGARFEESAEAGADDGMIIRDQDGERRHRWSP